MQNLTILLLALQDSVLSAEYEVSRDGARLGAARLRLESSPDRVLHRTESSFGDPRFESSSETALIRRGGRWEVEKCRLRFEFGGREHLSEAADAPTPEAALLLRARNGALADNHLLRVSVPTESGFAVREIRLRWIGSEGRFVGGRPVEATQFAVEDPPPGFAPRRYYVDSGGRLLEYATADGLRVTLASEIETVRPDRRIETVYRGGYSTALHVARAGVTFVAERLRRTSVMEMEIDERETWTFEMSPSMEIESMVHVFPGGSVRYDGHTRKLGSAAVDPGLVFCGTIDLAGLILVQRGALHEGGIHRGAILDPIDGALREAAFIFRGTETREYRGRSVEVRLLQIAYGDEILFESMVDKFGRAMEISDRRGELRWAVEGAELPVRKDPFRRPEAEKLPAAELSLDRLARIYSKMSRELEEPELVLERGAELEAELARYRALGGRDPRATAWEGVARAWVARAERADRDRQERRLGQLLAAGRLREAEELAKRLGPALKEEHRNRLARLRAAAKLEAARLEVSAVAWERDVVPLRLSIGLSLFGAGVSIRETAKIARIRGCCLLNGRLCREGDRVSADGVEVTVVEIRRDGVRVESSGATRDLFVP
jgi:hypothetical protein